ncbi:MAG: hypothetical protein DU481_14800 [Nitrosomonas sp.]
MISNVDLNCHNIYKSGVGIHEQNVRLHESNYSRRVYQMIDKNIVRASLMSFLILLILLSSFPIFASRDEFNLNVNEAIQSGNILIKNSYIIGFKKPSIFDQKDPEQPLIDPPAESALNIEKVPFGENSTGQSKESLANAMGLRGEVLAIFETMNATHVMMDEEEAERWRRDNRVEYVEQDMILTSGTTQSNPGWGLDRLDETSVTLDNTYVYTSTGAGRKIYILDSGLDLSNPTVAAQFGGRASVIWDINGGSGADCFGHGTQVSSAAAGSTKGIAKGATVIMAKITTGCTNSSTVSTSVTAFNWLAANETAGTIANWSNEFGDPGCTSSIISTSLENSIIAAHNKGVVVVVAAGNDSCNTANYSPTRISQAFVVGATNNQRISQGKDAKASFSRTGSNISVFAPGESVALLNFNGTSVLNSGTSFSAPYIAGIFAVACQAAGTLCDTATNATTLYDALRNTGVIGTVTNTDGTPLTGATSRFIVQQW